MYKSIPTYKEGKWTATVKEIKVGDFVQWLEESGVRNMEHQGEPHLVMYDHAIMCKLED